MRVFRRPMTTRQQFGSTRCCIVCLLCCLIMWALFAVVLASCGVRLSQAAERLCNWQTSWLHIQVSSCHQFEVARFMEDKTRQQIRRHVVDRESRQYAARTEEHGYPGEAGT